MQDCNMQMERQIVCNMLHDQAIRNHTTRLPHFHAPGSPHPAHTCATDAEASGVSSMLSNTSRQGLAMSCTPQVHQWHLSTAFARTIGPTHDMLSGCTAG